MMTDLVEMNGALYVVPGSHKLGRIEPYYDESTSYKFWAVPKEQLISILRNAAKPVPIVGPAGTALIFHCNLLHASGHNPQRRGPLARLHLLQRLRQRAALRPRNQAGLGRVAQQRAAADRGPRFRRSPTINPGRGTA
jgi:ectoine hydroxylase